MRKKIDELRNRSTSRGRSRSRHSAFHYERHRSGSIPDRVSSRNNRRSRSHSRKRMRDSRRRIYNERISSRVSCSSDRRIPNQQTVALRNRRDSSSSSRSRSPIGSHPRQKSHDQPLSNVTVSQLVEALQVMKGSSHNENLPISSLQNVIPEFDPARQEQTIDMWLHKVNECATIYNWSEKQTIHFSLPKLSGVAKKWYQGLDTLLFSWNEWQQKLKSAFPSDENYGQLLTTMLAKRARFGENLEDYFHEKVILLNRCNITGKRAIDCIIFGIEDRSVRLGAEAAQFNSKEKLLCYLRNTRGGKGNGLDRNKNRSYEKKSDFAGRNSLASGNLKRPPIKCYNCNGEGHYKSDCPKPILKCDKCLLFGHLVEKCPNESKRSTKDKAKTVMSVLSHESPDSKYFKTASVNGTDKRCFIDFGSEASLIKESEASDITCEWSTDNSLPILRGFGKSTVRALRKATVRIMIDGVEARVVIFVVPDYVMKFPLLIGQSYTEQPHIMFKKDSDNLEILLKRPKLDLLCDEDTVVNGLTAVRVKSSPIYTGAIYVDESLRLMMNNEHCLVQGVFSLSGGIGEILVKGFSMKEFILSKDTIVARCVPARMDNLSLPELEVRCVTNCDYSPIDSSDLDIDESLSADDISRLTTLLNQYRSCFSFSLGELGKTDTVEMSIKLKDDTPVVFRPYRLSVHERSQVRDMVQDLIRHGIVRPSTSSYSSPIVLVRKKNGEVRMCIDYRALNRKTVKENYPLPRVDDQLDDLAGFKYYTTLDLKSGYYQIQINENDRHKTAFITPDGHLEFNRMPSNVTINKLKEYFSIFGAPKRLISDRGSSFTSTSFKKFVDETGIKHVLNAVATPRANGQVERYNRTLLEALTAKCIGEPESRWDTHVQEVQWGLNNTHNRGIGNRLVFRENKYPICYTRL
ncbi:hypothetical protein ABMA27_005803 [Loxostege sticticalis]|uniref:Endonuclease n=1 Tax=Loxostege sticticalis TaxID=481309 RepID=A0ABR3HGK5_LOXSC